MVALIALAPEQRKSDELAQRVTRINSGDTVAVARLHDTLLEDLYDDQVRQLLRRSRGLDPNAPEDLYEFFLKKVEEYKVDRLFPSHAVAMSAAEASNDWGSLQQDIHLAAGRLWRDEFLQDTTDRAAKTRLRDSGGRNSASAAAARPQRERLENLLRQSHLLMLLWVEISLYRLRMISNFRAHQALGGAQTVPGKLQKSVLDLLHAYRQQVDEWDAEIHDVIGHRVFRNQPGDAQRFRAMSKVFDLNGLSLPAELGWAKDASDVSALLRFQYFTELHHERGLNPRTWPDWLWMGIFRVTTGFGMRPRRFVLTTAVTILVFAAAFFISDLNAPAGTNYPASLSFPAFWSQIGPHLYVAVTNLTSLGSDKPPNGPGAHVLLALSSLTGYFLLATLATLIIKQITEPDR